nr:unnamed protein product [Digitaria exilis]
MHGSNHRPGRQAIESYEPGPANKPKPRGAQAGNTHADVRAAPTGTGASSKSQRYGPLEASRKDEPLEETSYELYEEEERNQD